MVSIRAEILQEIELLINLHEKKTQSSECREFNHRAALLLQKVEDNGLSRLADRVMDLLSSCNPKDISQCDNAQRTKDALERLRDFAKANISE
jgi:hypothetical protein